MSEPTYELPKETVPQTTPEGSQGAGQGDTPLTPAEATAEVNGGTDQQTAQIAKPREKRRGLDIVALILGLATLLVAGYVLTDGISWVPTFDPRWVLAGGAVLVGLLLLGSSLRRGR